MIRVVICFESVTQLGMYLKLSSIDALNYSLFKLRDKIGWKRFSFEFRYNVLEKTYITAKLSAMNVISVTYKTEVFYFFYIFTLI